MWIQYMYGFYVLDINIFICKYCMFHLHINVTWLIQINNVNNSNKYNELGCVYDS